MQALNPKSVFISGEAYAREIKNFSRLHDLCYRPGIIGRAPFAALADWPGDWEGRTVLALSLHADSLHAYPAFLDDIVEDIKARCNRDGYRGELIDREAISEQVYPSHSWLMRGLIEYYRLTGRQDILEWINRILDKLFLPVLEHLDNYPVSKEDRKGQDKGEAAGTMQGSFREWRLSSDIGCIFIPLDGLTAAYELTGRKDILPLIYRIIELFKSTDYVENRLQTHASLTFMRGIMRLWRLEGGDGLLCMAKKFFADYKRYGMTPFWANLNWFMRSSWTEPCAVIDSYMLAHQLWEATGEAEYLDDSQMILFNGFYRGQRPNGGFGCDTTCENGVLGVRRQTYEAKWCCTMRAGEGLSYLARTAVYTDKDGITIPVFTDGRFDAGFAVLREKTEYPYEGKVQLTVESGDGSLRQIRLFAPCRGESFEIAVNGEKVPFTVQNGFVCFGAKMTAGSVISYTFAQRLHTEKVAGEIYKDSDFSVALYGSMILAGDKPFEKAPDLDSAVRVSKGAWDVGGMILKPVSEAYLMEKEELVESRFGLCFRGE